MSGICYIVGAGDNYGIDFKPKTEDLVIAADGGYAELLKAKIRPDLVIGDFDSLGYVPAEQQLIKLPTEKDDTDLWTAVEHGVAKGYDCFFLYGCTGGRVDHTLANIQIAASLAQRGKRCLIFDKTQIITAICNETLNFEASYAGYLTVLSYTDCCEGVTLKGLKYELTDAVMTNSHPLGVSNEFLGIPSSITVGCGTAILVYSRKSLQTH